MELVIKTNLPTCNSWQRKIGTCTCVTCEEKRHIEYSQFLIDEANRHKQQFDSRGSCCMLDSLTEIRDKYTREFRGRDLNSMMEYESLNVYYPGECEITTVKEKELEKIEILKGRDGEVIRKTLLSDEEVLIHRSILIYLQNNPYILNMFPKFIGISSKRGERGQAVCYMEKVGGITLREAIRQGGVTEREAAIILMSIHSVLDLLWHSPDGDLGFIHGDLKNDNIILRGYGEGKVWQVPYSIDGLKWKLIELPYLPVIIDFGLSSTNKYSCTTFDSSPYSNEMIDVVMLYREFSSDDHHPISIVSSMIERLYGKEWCKTDGVPPLPLICPQLTHRAIVDMYIKYLGL